jgi:hypothetical protein
LTLVAMPPALTTLTVVAAGEYTLGSGRTATLTPLEVAQTPGAAANVAKALQTLPGAQGVDEGSGLFVRGGDVTETRVLLDDAWLLSPARFDNPTGHVTVTVNPFLLDRTVYSAGGFGAAYGNALSGVVRLETAGRPLRSTGSATASIGSVGAQVALAPHARVGLRASAQRTDLRPLFALFGAAQPFDPAPRGGDLSATLEWQSGRAGRVRLFGLRQGQRVGVGAAGIRDDSRYANRTVQDMLVLSWRDSATAWRPAVTVAHSAYDRRETFGPFTLGTVLTATHAVASLGWVSDRGLGVRAGGEFERLTGRFSGADAGAGGESRQRFTARVPGDRAGVFGEVTWQDARGLRVVGGVRTDRATLTARRTVDPRLSVAWQRGRVGLTAAWGVLHQVADPVFYRPSGPGAVFAPMRVAQTIVGVQVGDDTTGLRVELYDKRYRDLWQFTRDFGVAGGGRGRAQGADVFLRWRFGAASRSRLAWSVVQSRRSDPETGVEAPALGDVRHSIAWITDRTLGRLTVSTALRHATGRPFTDVVGVREVPGGVEPAWGAPNAGRLPGYWRSDVSASWYRPLGARRGLVLWGDLSNVFDRRNVMRYVWTADFRTRTAVRAPFNRALYAGATLLF